MKYSTISRRPTIGLGSRCTIHERDRFEQLCKQNGVTMLKGINLLVRQAISKNTLPMEYDYENPKNLKKHRIPEYADVFDIYDFIRMVERGSIIDDDGTGCISDGKFMYYDIEVDVEWLLDQAQTYKYVCWFNK
jgi:antitoxin component of RelBE/YafQ-DinJ toxin-antitoxin module